MRAFHAEVLERGPADHADGGAKAFQFPDGGLALAGAGEKQGRRMSAAGEH